MIKIPKSIKPGDTIGIVAPSFGATTEPYITRFNEALKIFEQKGYKVVVGECCHKSDGIGISTDPKIAAQEVMDFYLNPQIDAIFSCGGGELMCQTVGYIDFEKLQNAPAKWFIGYSDNTNFIFPLATISQTASVYGQNAPSFGKPWEQSEFDAFGLLEGTVKKVKGYEKFQNPNLEVEDAISPYILTDKKVLKVFESNNGESKEIVPTQENPVIMEGILLGGCLDCLATLCGTKLDNVQNFVNQAKSQNQRIIWFFESCDLNVMSIRRALWQLKNAGWLENVAGFVIGRPLAAFGEEAFGMNQYNAVTGILSDYNVPIIMDADIGHIDPTIPLIVGAKTKVTIKDNNIEFEF